MKKFLTFLCAVTLVSVFSVPAFSMTITAYDSNIAQSLVGSGITISNVTYTGATSASGYFSGGIAAGIGIESGIVLTSGAAANLDGTSNTSDSITADNGLSGISYLNTLAGQNTYDATVLEFDFVSIGDAAYFSYVFGSDEYNEWVGSEFNDVFGFFLDGTAVADNVATLDDGTVVSVNSINNGSHSSYYNDNDNNTAYPFEYDGFTNVLVASMLGLTANTTHHLTLAIADSSDYVWDSGVFLGTGSFTPNNPVPEPSTILLMGIGLLGLVGYSRKRSKKS